MNKKAKFYNPTTNQWEVVDADNAETLGGNPPEYYATKDETGILSNLKTTEKANLVGAVNEVFDETTALNDRLDTNENNLTSHLADLASNQSGKGAALVGIENKGIINATNVFNAIERLTSTAFNIFPDTHTARVFGHFSADLPFYYLDKIPQAFKDRIANAIIIFKGTDGAPVYNFTEEMFLNPSLYGRGYYIAKYMKNGEGNWVIDGNVVTIGSPATAGFQLTFDTSANVITGKGGYVKQILLMFLPAGYEKYIPYTTV